MNILNKKMPVKNVSMPLVSITAFLLLTLFLVGFSYSAAYSVDFVTGKEFDAEKTVYKDYPQKILFKKLFESNGADKRKIRNVIILKHVFDRNMQEKVKTGIIEYKKHYGIIKGVSRDHLRLWNPQTDTVSNFFTGIDRIPMENNNNFEVTESNIGKFASIAYTIDNRIYKIEISFILATPDNLYIKRERNDNIITWSIPSRIKKPSEYRVFANNKLAATLQEPIVKIPRKKGRADTYYVKTGYKHGESLIWSKPSPSIYDEITANEIKQEAHVKNIYNSMITALNPSEWQAAQKILYKNRKILTERLDEKRKEMTVQLTRFFRNMDAGDRLAGIQPETIKDLEMAITFYDRADQQAKPLLPGIDVLFITQLKASKIIDRIKLLETNKKISLAKNRFSEITAAINPSEWQNARNLLYNNRQLLVEYLNEEQKANMEQLTQFFRNTDEGDRIGGILPETTKNLETAITFYRRADQKAKALPTGIDVQFITQLKMNESLDRIGLLKSKNKKLLAENTYNKVIAALTPAEWEKAKTITFSNQQLMAENLDKDKKENTEILIMFFKDIAEGDRIGNGKPETINMLETALTFYERAGKKAMALPPDIDISFIAQIKTSENRTRVARLQTRNNKLLAQKTYNRILFSINPSEWQTARKLLYDNRPLLTDYLDSKPKANAENLIRFFRNVDEGDRLQNAKPESLQNLDLAITFYERADQKATTLPPDIDVLFITQLKKSENRNKRALLETSNKKIAALKIYNRITNGLNPNDWQKAKQNLYENRQILTEHLDVKQKSTTELLVQFFLDIDEGDRITSTKPATIGNHDKALDIYRRAESTAKSMPDIDVMFITRLKIQETHNSKELLYKTKKRLMAEETYGQITDAINPAEWEAAKEYIYKHRLFLTENLDDKRKSTTDKLVHFFRDIDEGDRFGSMQPESLNNLEKALEAYSRAESKTTGIPDSIDVMFITQLKTKKIFDRKAALERRLRKLSARKAEAKKQTIQNEDDRKKYIKEGLINFNDKNYKEALNNFRVVFSDQITNLEQTGKRRIKGLLSLPAQYRAEIVFLVELDKLTEESENTDEDYKTSLIKIAESINAGKGLWVIISASGKKRIKQHIADFDQ